MQTQSIVVALAGMKGIEILQPGKVVKPPVLNETLPKGYNIDPKKFDYFFGKVTTSHPHNIQRSVQNLKDLNAPGIINEQAQTGLFNKAASDSVIISQISNNFGITVVKRISISDKGAIQVGFFYPKGNISAIPKVTSLIHKIASNKK